MVKSAPIYQSVRFRIGVGIVLLILALLAVFNLSSKGKQAEQKPESKQIQQADNFMFDRKTAEVFGKITKVEGNMLTVTNRSNQSEQFPVNSKVVIFKPKPNSAQASASSELKSIELSKEAYINLEMAGGKYQILSISYSK